MTSNYLIRQLSISYHEQVWFFFLFFIYQYWKNQNPIDLSLPNSAFDMTYLVLGEKNKIKNKNCLKIIGFSNS